MKPKETKRREELLTTSRARTDMIYIDSNDDLWTTLWTAEGDDCWLRLEDKKLFEGYRELALAEYKPWHETKV